jgi:hypothetical protein
MLWSSLECTRDEWARKVELEEEELARILVRLTHDRKKLRQAEDRVNKRIICLADASEGVSDLDAIEESSIADATIGVSPAILSALCLSEGYGGSVTEAAGNL